MTFIVRSQFVYKYIGRSGKCTENIVLFDGSWSHHTRFPISRNIKKKKKQKTYTKIVSGLEAIMVWLFTRTLWARVSHRCVCVLMERVCKMPAAQKFSIYFDFWMENIVKQQQQQQPNWRK